MSCANPARLQQLCETLDSYKIDVVFRKGLVRLPHPFRPEDRAAGYLHALSALHAEFCLTQVLDFPRTGRQFFEEIIRENLDLGRPDRVQLIFKRRVTQRTPGAFRTRVLTEGVVPSLYAQYKHTKIKPYHKEGRALRTENTINDPYDFAIGRKLCNLPALREIGFAANRRLLDVQTLSHDCVIGEARFHAVLQPIVQASQRASAFPFGDPRVFALLQGPEPVCPPVHRLCQRRWRVLVTDLLDQDPTTYSPGRMTYDLRRLRRG